MFFVYVKIVLTNQQEKENFGLFKMRRIYKIIIKIYYIYTKSKYYELSYIYKKREREREKLSVTKLARTNVEGKCSLLHTL